MKADNIIQELKNRTLIYFQQYNYFILYHCQWLGSPMRPWWQWGVLHSPAGVKYGQDGRDGDGGAGPFLALHLSLEALAITWGRRAQHGGKWILGEGMLWVTVQQWPLG